MKRKTRTLCLILSMGIAFVGGMTATIVSDPLNLWLGKPGGYWESKEEKEPKEKVEVSEQTEIASVSDSLTELVQNIVFDLESGRINSDSEFVRTETFDAQSNAVSERTGYDQNGNLVAEIENPSQNTETSISDPSKSSDSETENNSRNKNMESGKAPETEASESDVPAKNNSTENNTAAPSGSFNPEDNPNRTITYDPPRAGDGLLSDKQTALEQTEVEWNGKSYPMTIWTNPF